MPRHPLRSLLVILAVLSFSVSAFAQNVLPGNPGAGVTPAPPIQGGMGDWIVANPPAGATAWGFGDGSISGAGSSSGNCNPSTLNTACAMDVLAKNFGMKEVNYGVAGSCLQQTTTVASPCNSANSGIARYQSALYLSSNPASTWVYISYGTVDSTTNVTTDAALNPTTFEANLTTVVQYVLNQQVPGQHIVLATIPYTNVADPTIYANVFLYNAAIARVATKLRTILALSYEYTAFCGSSCLQTTTTLNNAGHALLAKALEAPNYSLAQSAQEAFNVEGAVVQNQAYYLPGSGGGGAPGPTGPPGPGSTTTTANFTFTGISYPITMQVANNTAFPLYSYALVSDGTTSFIGQVTNPLGSGTITLQPTTIVADPGGVPVTVMSGAAVTFAGPQGATGPQGPTGPAGSGANCTNVAAAPYNVDMTGTNDSTVAFQSAVNALIASKASGSTGAGNHGGCLFIPAGTMKIGGVSPYAIDFLCGSTSGAACPAIYGSGSTQTYILSTAGAAGTASVGANIFEGCQTNSAAFGYPSVSGYVPALPNPVACGGYSSKHTQNQLALYGMTLAYQTAPAANPVCVNASTCGVVPAAISLPNVNGLTMWDVNIQNADACVRLGWANYVKIDGPSNQNWQCFTSRFEIHGGLANAHFSHITYKGGRQTGSGPGSLGQGIATDYTDSNPMGVANILTTAGIEDAGDWEGSGWGVLIWADYNTTIADTTWTGDLCDGFTFACFAFLTQPSFTNASGGSSSPGGSQHLSIDNNRWMSAWEYGAYLDGGFYNGANGGAALTIQNAGLFAGANTRDNGASITWLVTPELCRTTFSSGTGQYSGGTGNPACIAGSSGPTPMPTMDPAGWGGNTAGYGADYTAAQVVLTTSATAAPAGNISYPCAVVTEAPYDNPRQFASRLLASCNSVSAGGYAYFNGLTIGAVSNSPGVPQTIQVVDTAGMAVGEQAQIDTGGTNPENIIITNVVTSSKGCVAGACTITATFAYPHNAGVPISLYPAPPYQMVWTYTGSPNIGLLGFVEEGSTSGKLSGSVTGSGSPQTVYLGSGNSAAGFAVNGVAVVDTSSSGVQENVTITGIPDDSHITGIFTHNHSSGAPVVQNAIANLVPGGILAGTPTLASYDTYRIYTTGRIVPGPIASPYPGVGSSACGSGCGVGGGTCPTPSANSNAALPGGGNSLSGQIASYVPGGSAPIYCQTGSLRFGAAVQFTNYSPGITINGPNLHTSDGACVNVDANAARNQSGQKLIIQNIPMGQGCAFSIGWPSSGAPNDYLISNNDMAVAGSGTFTPSVAMNNHPGASFATSIPVVGSVGVISGNRGFTNGGSAPFNLTATWTAASGTLYYNASPYLCSVNIVALSGTTIGTVAVNGTSVGVGVTNVLVPAWQSITISWGGGSGYNAYASCTA